MNAVVGVFLRVLEYFNGLLFLTTNRIDDIDEAIVSRCIALIRFHSPDAEARKRIWGVMSEQFALGLDDALIDTLVELFPADQRPGHQGPGETGREILSPSRNASDLEVFKRCAVFRGMDSARRSPLDARWRPVGNPTRVAKATVG